MSTCNSSSKNFIPMANKYDRVVLLVDMDCFYCQVEEKLDPLLKNQPVAVVQYNAWRGGGIIAVNYAARAKGVTRHMRGDEAKEQCPEIQLVKVPNVREKADLTKYREAGNEVAKVLQRFTPFLERASVDEAYLDITEAVNKRLQEMNDGSFILQPQELVNTYAVGFPTIGEFVTTITTSFIEKPLADDDSFYRNFNENDVPGVRKSNIRLLIGASIASEIRSAVKVETSYECSAGIAHNKILAKLACGINKPNKQTILPLAQIPALFETLPVGKIKGLGAKFGEEVCERLNVRYLGQLLKFTEAELQKKIDEKSGTWLYNICRGIDLEAVTPRFYSKSIGSCKKFPGRNNITGLKTLQHWINELANEINERLEKDICENNRRAKQMVVNFIQEFDGEEISSSRSAPLQSYDTEILTKTTFELIKVNTKQFFRSGSESVLNNPIKFLGISVGKFETISNSQNNIQKMFAQQAAKKQKLENSYKDEQQTLVLNTNSTAILENESKNNNEIKQIPNEKKCQNVKSFFLSALKKEPPKETVKLTLNDSHVEVTNGTKATTIQLESVKQNYLKTKPPDIQTLLDNINCIESSNKGLFGNIINENEDVIKKPAPINVALKTLDKSSYDSESDCNENDFNYTKNIQRKSTNYNLELQNENSSLSNHLINTTINIANISNTQMPVVVSEPENGPINIKRKYNNITDDEEHKHKMDYRSQYAEFAVPEFIPTFLDFINCSKCGVQILSDPISVQTHQDHHFAQELSQKQRHEFRDEIRTRINTTRSPPSNVANKKSKKEQFLNISKKKQISSDITKFLKPALPFPLIDDRNQVPENNTLSMDICEICKLHIRIDQISEHKDFHIAKDLQKKINQLEVRTVEVAKKPSSDLLRNSLNRSMITSSSQSKVTAKPITQYFTQSNTNKF